jgi:putrescine importer
MAEPLAPVQPIAVTAPRLRRVLTLWDLVFYGMVLIQPVAPVPLFGVAQKLSNGFFSTTILVALLAMIFTAFSYGRMAGVYPSAGSAYTYVGKGLNSYLGFLVGWAMILDYILIPLTNSIWVAVAIRTRYLPQLPYWLAMLLVVGLVTALNLRGIKSSARANKILLVFTGGVAIAFVVVAIRYLFHYQGWSSVFSTQPFYDPKTFNGHTVWTATSYAALTYIGFDGVTTLTEEVKNPKRNVLLATVLVCLFAGGVSALEVYLGQLVWPNWHAFSNLETAFLDICRRAGGGALFQAMAATIIVASFGGSFTGVLAAARLLFGMGRDNVLPRHIFSHISPRNGTPSYNILLIGVILFGSAIGLEYIGNAYEHAGELVNFGAFFAFMGVNLAAFWQFAVVQRPECKPRLIADTLPPLFGFAFCAVIWWNLNPIAKTIGGIWFAAGLAYLAVTTRGFKTKPVMIHLDEPSTG